MVIRVLPWVAIALAFCLVGVFYNSLPAEITITRRPFGGSDLIAPKSVFTAFRVVLIDLLCALAIEIMLWRTVSPKVRRSYLRFWHVLMLTVGFKCLLQAFELIAAPQLTSIYFYAVIAVVAIGFAVAAFFGRNLISNFDRADWKLGLRESCLLGGLFAGYLAIAIGPAIYYR